MEGGRSRRSRPVGGNTVFGVPSDKDGVSSGADDPDGHPPRSRTSDIRAEVGDDLVIMADLCLCEYTDHGHCGIVTEDGYVDNDATLERYASTAVVQALRLRAHGYRAKRHDGWPGRRPSERRSTGRLSLSSRSAATSAKYAPAFYGLFREAFEKRRSRDRATWAPAGPGQRARGPGRRLGLDLAEGAEHGDGKAYLERLDVIRWVADMDPFLRPPPTRSAASTRWSRPPPPNGWLDRTRRSWRPSPQSAGRVYAWPS